MCSVSGRVHSLESFGTADGPGVRYVVFLQGCRLRCRYCHNPDTWSQNTGREMSAEEVFEKAWRCRAYWGEHHSHGGITVSGGEPMLQLPFVIRLFSLAKAHGVHTALDTAGEPFTQSEPFLGDFERLLSLTDLVMLDIKAFSPHLHRELTGSDNRRILACARFCAEKGIPLWLRHVVVPGLTDQPEELSAIARFASTLPTVEKVEALPYHTMGVYKWEKLGIPYSLADVKPPDDSQMEAARALLRG